jgi:2-polyprenyl-3-methyl-5-hydroxy-6-metoxy-1,4-benzoquinol methylase
MQEDARTPRGFDPQNEAEFDRYAAGYDDLHRASIAASGEDPEYFARYKRDVLVRLLGSGFSRPVLDFGCGIGNLTRFLVESFANVSGFDPSRKSIELAQKRCEGATFLADLGEAPRNHYGAIVVANVLHHVKPAERDGLLRDLVTRLAPGGKLVVFEHNPLNPLTRRAVAACPFDEDAVLLWPWEATRLLARAGLAYIERDFIVFFPRALAKLRPLEPKLRAVPVGAQIVAWGERV